MDVELFSKKDRLVDPFKKVRTRKEVDFQWARVAVTVGPSKIGRKSVD